MNPCRWFPLVVLIVFAGGDPCPAQPTPEQPKGGSKSFNVKLTANANVGGSLRTGIVNEIDEKGMSVLCDNVKDQQVVLVQIDPLDLHTQGKVAKNAQAHNAYRWQDVKKGDHVWIEAKYDDGLARWYCITVCIR